MKNFILLSMLIYISLYSFRSEAVEASWALRKGSQWLAQNQSLSPVRLEASPDITYSREVLFQKIIDVVKVEKPFDDLAYNVLYALIYQEPVLALNAKEELLKLINDLSMTEAQKFKLIWILNEKSTASIEQSVVVPMRTDVSIAEVLKSARSAIESLKLPKFLNRKLIGTLDTVKKVLLDSIPEDDCYNTSSSCQFSSNKGIVHYYSKRIHENHELTLAVIRLGIRVQYLNKKHAVWLKDGPQFDQHFDLNLWPVYLDVAGGDAALALETLSVFGHDVTANQLYSKTGKSGFLTTVVNAISPSKYGTDSNPASVIFLPGAVDGLVPSKKVVKKLKLAIAHYDKVHKTKTTMRHGYHHVNGGVLMAQELLRDGYGEIGSLDSSSMVSHVMGYAYKRLQMGRYLTKDAAELWKNMGENEFKKAKAPQGWNEERFIKAAANLRLHLAMTDYTEDQHRAGARFAVKIYQD